MSTLAGTTALVTGATGFLGGAVARRLAAAGVCVRALARRTGRDSYIRDVANIEIVSGSITEPDRMMEVTQGCEYVFHVAALTRGRLSQQRPTNRDGTANVARAAAKAGVKRLVHVSSIAVYGYQYRGIVTEDFPQIPGNVPYNITKSEAERALQRVAAETRLSYSIIRPGMIFGPRSGAWTELVFKLAKLRPVPFIGDGSVTVFPIYVDDVVDLMLLQAIHPAAHNEAFNCVYQPQPTAREFLGKYMTLARNDRWRAYPIWPTRLLSPIADMVLHLAGEPQDTQDIVRLLESKVIYAIDKARHLLGWQPQVDIDEGIRRCKPYLQEIGLL